ncbi:MAG: serine/threonine-protein kinase [Polyangiaceae bacterium]
MSRRPQPGDVIRGKYRIIRLIGDGGMGTVYEAKHEVLGTPVALKFLHPELAKRPGLVSRFLQEAKVSASIQSPHVTRVTDVDQTEDGAAFIVMELLSGEPLQAVLDREHKLSRDRAIDFALQMLSGLEAAHALGVVHRDLKPDNVFITRTSGGPLLRLLDFGIAKLRETNEYKKGLTRPGAIMGTPEYMAPEQAYSADQVDHRADIYSMGAMLYEMLVGQRPANGEDAHMIISQVTTGRVKRITEYDQTIPEPLAEVIHKAMAPRPEERFASATEMRLALARYAGELSHAGRLAATPAPPSGDYPATEKTGGPPASKSTVPKTLPPEDEAPPALVGTEQGDFGKGGTQEVSPQVVQEQMRMTGMQPQSPYGPPPNAPVPGGTTPGAMGPGAMGPGAMGPGGMAPGVPGPGMGMPGPLGGPPGYYPQPPRKKGGKGIIWLLLTVMLGAGAAAAVIVVTQQDDDTPAALPTIDTAPNTTVAPENTSPTPTPPTATGEPIPDPTSTSTSRPSNPSNPKPPKADAGAPDAGAPQIPPFTLPSTLPAIPSTLPPFPTNLPQIPGLPPFQPQPAPSN